MLLAQFREPAAFGRLCVETSKLNRLIKGRVQPPSGGCVLKPDDSTVDGKVVRQPPSGGCVLKHRVQQKDGRNLLPAAFGRLCVETILILRYQHNIKPAAFGRLCVETKNYFKPDSTNTASRLRAAVC